MLKFDEQSDNKLNAIERGNQKNFTQNPEIVNKVMNKEDRYGHIFPLHLWVCFLSAGF